MTPGDREQGPGFVPPVPVRPGLLAASALPLGRGPAGFRLSVLGNTSALLG